MTDSVPDYSKGVNARTGRGDSVRQPDDQPFHMWKYWRDKKGIERALTEYYSTLLEQSFMLKQAFISIQSAELLINAVFRKLTEEEQDREETDFLA